MIDAKTAAIPLVEKYKQWRKKRKLLNELHGELVEYIGMNWWKRAGNVCHRIKRVKSL